MAKGYVLSAADRKQIIADHKRLTGGGTSQRPIAKRRRGPRGGAAGKSVKSELAVLIKTLTAPTLTVNIAGKSISIQPSAGGFATAAAYVFELADGSPPTAGLTAVTKGGEGADKNDPKAFDAALYGWEMDIKAGTGSTFQDGQPVLVTGWRQTYDDAGVTREAFMITAPVCPITIVKGSAPAVNGGNWVQSNLQVLWGRKLQQSTLPDVFNPDGWKTTTGGYALAMILPSGQAYGLDLHCP